jgi:hypothetical protein
VSASVGPVAGAPTPAVQPAGAGGVARGPGAVHEHAWALMRFELVDDRPMVRQRCETCGFVRGYRAWERYWTPGDPEIRR